MEKPEILNNRSSDKSMDSSLENDDHFPRKQSQLYIFIAVAFASLTILRILIWIFTK